MPRNILIDPQRLGSANPNIQFSGSMANTIRLEVLTSGSVQFTGVSGSLLSITDSLSGSLFAVSDVSGLPILETFSDDRVVMGRFGTNALVVTGSFVGIGTSNPATRLHLFSSTADAMTLASAAGTTYIDMKHSTSTTFGYVGNGGMVVGASTSDVALRSISGGVVFATAGGAERMRVDSVGNIGIGTSAPTARLFVSGAVNSSTPTMIVQEGVVNPTGGAAAFDVRNSAGTSILLVSGSGTVGISNGNVLYANSQGMKLDVRGNIGITNGGAIFIGDGTTFYRRLIAQDISPSNVLRVGQDTFQFGTLTLSSQNSADLFALSQGNVGIGSTSPTARFQVSGSATASNPTMIVREGVVNPTGGVGILNVQNSAGTSLFFVSGSGNVGIGISSPTTLLNIRGSSPTFSIDDTINGTSSISFRPIGASYVERAGISVNYSTGEFKISAGAVSNGYYHTFYTNGSERARIDTAGNFGIGGGTNITAKLLVTGSGAGATNTMHLVNSAGASLMIVRDNGTVGIGTTTPSLKLDFGNSGGFLLKGNPGPATSVVYTGHFHNDFMIGAFIDGSSYLNGVLSFGHVADSARKFHIGSASDSSFNASTTFVPTMTFTAGNNVGIGTTTPGARLEVTGSSSTSGAATFSAKNSSGTSLLFVRNDGNVGIGTTLLDSRLVVNGNSVFSGSVLPDGDLTRDLGSLTKRWANIYVNNLSTPSISAQLTGSNLVNGMVLFAGATGGITGSQSQFFWNNSTNRLGIGTSNPTTTLQVVGDLTLGIPGAADRTLTINSSNAANKSGQIYFSGAASAFVIDGLIANQTLLLGKAAPSTTVFSTIQANINGNASGYFNWSVAGSEKMRIDTAGNVGIGTNTASARLIVSGSVTATTPTMIVREGVVSPLGGVGVFDVQNSVNASLFFVSGSGNVGIGTNSPHIAAGYSVLSLDSTTNGGMINIRRAGTNFGYIYSSGVGLFDIEAWSGISLRFNVNNAERMRIDTGGNVGIGTPTYTARLHVSGSSTGTTPTLLVRHGIANGSNLPVVNVQDAAGTSLLFVSGSGNIGIGTTDNLLGRVHLNAGNLYMDGTAGAFSTAAYNSSVYSRIVFDNDYSDAARGPNRITLHDVGNWMAGFGIHAATMAYYSGDNHSWYRMTSTTPSLRMTLDSSGVLAPGSNNTQDIGTSGTRWRDIYARSGSFTGDINITGNLTVLGTQTIVNSTVVDIGDNIITLNSVASPQRYGGLYVNDTTANTTGSLLWDSDNNYWVAGLKGSEAIVPTGTGTNNLVARWTSASTLSTGVLYDTAARVGIGSATPNYELDIVVNTNAFDGVNLYGAQGGTSEFIGYRAVNPNGTGLIAGVGGAFASSAIAGANIPAVYSVGSIALVLGTNSAERMRISSTGDVGIGTAVPGSKLHVQDGPILVQGADTTNSGVGLRIVNTSTALAAWTIAGRKNLSVDSLVIRENNPLTSDRFVLQSGGNVGIGSGTSVTSRLLVSGSGNTSSTSTMNLVNSSGTSLLFVRDDGNTGFGSASPGAKVDINTSAAIASYVTPLRLSQTSTAANSGQQILFYNTENTWEQGAYGSLREGANNSFSLTFMPSVTGTNTERMRILSNGNVGIGGTNPTSRLEVTGSTNTSGASALHVINSAGTSLLFVRNDGPVGIGTGSPTSFFQVSSVAQGNFRLDVGGTGGHYYQAETTPRLGIGRDLPYDSTQTASGYVSFTNGGGTVAATGAALAIIANRTLSLFTSNATALTPRMTIDGSGNVGIGLTNPSVRLHVVGASILANNTSIDPDTYTNAVVAGAISDSGWAVTSAIGGNAGTGDSWAIGHNGSNLYFGIQNGSAANTMATFMQVSPGRSIGLFNNVGIGTTTPAYTLDVNGDLNVGKTSGGSLNFFNARNWYEGSTAVLGASVLSSQVYSNGRKLYPDETFSYGTNGIVLYDNAGSGQITVTRISSTGLSPASPNNSGFVLQVQHTGGGQVPAFGGFTFQAGTRANATLVCVFKAYLPTGYTLNWASNSVGTNANSYWASTNSGTGAWQDYVYVLKCGATGTFSSTMFFYVTGSPTPSAGSPLTWYISSATVYDLDDKVTYVANSNAGSGATNYLSKWTSASNLGTSIVYDNGTRVGIGTTDFTYTVSDNTPVVGSITNNVLYANGSIQLNGNNDAIVFGRSTSTFIKDEELGFGWGSGWYMTDSTWLRTRNNGSLFVGGGGAYIAGNSGIGGTGLNFTSRLLITGSGDTSSTSTLHAVNSSGASLLFVRNDGNVGIGSNSPSYTIDARAQSNADTILRLVKTASTSTTMQALGGALAFGVDTGTGTTERVRIDTSGNVGIGSTTTSGVRLHVSDNQSNATARFQLANVNGNGGPLRIGYFSDSGGFHITANGNPAHTNLISNTVTRDYTARFAFEMLNLLTTTSDNSYVDFRFAGGSTFSSAMRIRADGNVGIGTTLLDSRLVVNGNSVFSGSVLPDGDNTRDLGSPSKRWANFYVTNFAPASVTAQLTGSNLVDGMVLFSGATGGITGSQSQFFWNNTTNRLGIGTSSPGYTLDVSGDINLAANRILRVAGATVINTNGSNGGDIYINSRVIRNESATSTDGMYIGYGNSGTTGGHLRFYANNITERMRIYADTGNVAITDLPGNVASTTARLLVSGSSTGTIPTLQLRHGVANGSNLPVMNIQDSAGNSLLFVSGGGPVGIGNTQLKPWSSIFRTLQIGSSSYFSIAAQTTVGAAGSILWNAYGTGDESFAYSVGGGDRATRYRQQYDFRWYVAGPSGATDSPVTFTESMRLDTSGQLGIGIAPSAKLHVAGGRTILASSDGYELAFGRSASYFYFYNDGAGATGKLTLTATAGITAPIITFTQQTQDVGIGTTSYTARLFVSGSSTATTPTMIVREGVVSPTAGALVFEVEKSDGSTIFAVSGSGNVGIGTSIPNAKFEVVGTSGSLLSVTDSLVGSLFSVNDITGVPILEVFSDDRVVAGAVNANALVVTGSVVGIGTSLPQARLHVSGTSDVATPSLLVRHGVPNGSSTSIAQIQNSSGTNVLFVSASGDIGINGTPTNFASYNYLTHYGRSTTLGGVFQSSTSNSSFDAQFWVDSGGGAIASNILRFFTNSLERVRIDNSGIVYVGGVSTQLASESVRIGRASVQNSLLLNNTAVDNAAIVGVFNDAAALAINRSTSTGGFVNTGKYAAEVFAVGSASTSYVSIATAAAANTTPSERMRVDASGNMTIGTAVGTAAQSLVHLMTTGGGDAPRLTFTNGTTGHTASDGSFVGISNGTQLTIWNKESSEILFATNNNERMRIDSSGRSVWSTGPSGATASTTNGLQLWYDSTNNKGYIRATQEGVDHRDLVISGKSIDFWNQSGASRMFLDSSGNVGIGTNSPFGSNCRLSVQLAGTTRSNYTAPSNAGFLLDCGTGTNGAISMVGGGALGYYFTNSTAAYDAGMEIASRVLTFRVGNASRVSIDTSGNVTPAVDNTQNLGSSTLRWANIHATSVIVSSSLGPAYSTPSSTSGTTAIFDTIVTAESGAVYELMAMGCLNVGGSGEYRDIMYGKIIIGTGYNYTNSTVATYISYISESPDPRSIYTSANSPAKLTADVVFLSGGNEVTSVTNGTSATIRVKISGYVGTVGANTTVRLKKLL